MLCEIPIPRAPKNVCPGAANGRNGAATAAGPKTQRPSATTTSSANGRDEPPRGGPHRARAPQVEPRRAPNQHERDEPPLKAAEPRREEPDVLKEQHWVDRHVDQRVDPGEPPVPEPPEAPEGALHPHVIAAFGGQHRGELADQQRLGHAENDRCEHEQEQRDARPHRSDQALQSEGAARDGEVHHRHERPESERGGPPHRASSLCGGL